MQRALHLFWERGYEGTSFDDLIATMRLSPSSFYNSFGSKEQLYREAVEAYLATSGELFRGVLSEETDTKSAFRNLLEAAAREFSSADHPSGCMISLAGTHVAPSLAGLRATMTGHRRNAQEAMAARLRKGIEEGDVSAATDVDALAAYYSALSRGLAVQARDGATLDRLLQIVSIAMNAWPVSP
ncbi:TetR/AcrR family transcriptional regulator [Mesorhizobium prunaredense]|uniref:TetR/AcrR family transcriptional regulator n=1 Tax=Mesorhizobium prunaredense TaxID=1631249 RepID=UPI001AEC9D82|nr:TetR/AcrR family transcriptional regulator [Mesorhizobium prunaredense]